MKALKYDAGEWFWFGIKSNILIFIEAFIILVVIFGVALAFAAPRVLEVI